jgi:taurine dioxygenase
MEQFALDAVERLTTRPREAYDSFSVAPLTPLLGAEISGLDLSRELTPRQEKEIKLAFLTHHVLVFHDQHLTPEDHKRFARLFGPLHPDTLPAEGSDPYVLEISADKNSREVAGNGWHADGTADPEPSLGSMLHLTTIPEGGSGGDTLFANMHLAWDRLPAELKRAVAGRRAEHNYLARYAELQERSPWRPNLTPAQVAEVKPVSHPVVRTHPETGRKALFVSEHFTTRILGVPEDESRDLLRQLFAHSTRPEFIYRHRWQPFDLVFWDNRSLMHLAAGCPEDQRRKLYRTTIEGDTPF